MSKQFETELILQLNAGRSAFSCVTADLASAESSIKQVCRRKGYNLLTWGPFTGLEMLFAPDGLKQGDQYMEAKGTENKFNSALVNKRCDIASLAGRMTADALASATSDVKIPSGTIILLNYVQDFMQNSTILQAFVHAIAKNWLSAANVRLIFLGMSLNFPSDLTECLTPLVFSLPDEVELYNLIQEVEDSTRRKICSGLDVKVRKSKLEAINNSWLANKDVRPTIVRHLKGLTRFNAEGTLYYAVSRHWKDSSIDNVVQTINSQKMLVIEKSKLLRFIPAEDQPNENEIGGFDNLLDFVKMRANLFSTEAQEQNMDTPKGVVLMGPPGTGKSLAAKAIGKMLKLPVIILDIGELFGMYVGESESRARDALQTIDAVGGSIVLIDECDKAFAGNKGGGAGDHGTTQRVFGTILSWMQEHKSHTFVVMTLNNVDALPPELMRDGRFDGRFYTDLPTDAERKAIINIHLNKRGCKVRLSDTEWAELLRETEGFVGAELEALVKDARLLAFFRRKSGNPTPAEIMSSLVNRSPMFADSHDAGLMQVMELYKRKAIPVSRK